MSEKCGLDKAEKASIRNSLGFNQRGTKYFTRPKGFKCKSVSPTRSSRVFRDMENGSR